MTLLLYAIGDRHDQAVDVPGLDGRPLRLIVEDELAAWVSETDQSPRPTKEALWDYECAVERLMERFTILPARFGSVLADEPAVRAELASRRAQLVLGLNAIRGAVELGIRAEWSQPGEVPANAETGTAYMLARLELDRRARGISRALAPLRALARSSIERIRPAANVPVLSAHLVDHAGVDEFTRLVARLQARLEGEVTLACTGPWPPYSFVKGVQP